MIPEMPILAVLGSKGWKVRWSSPSHQASGPETRKLLDGDRGHGVLELTKTLLSPGGFGEGDCRDPRDAWAWTE